MGVVPDSNPVNSPAPVPADPAVDPSEIAELRRIAVHLAETAAAHVRARRREVFDAADARPDDAVQAKSSPTDPVTVVDTETEQLIRALLTELRPGERVLGEEGGGSLGGESEIVWVVDPIDGTVNFMYGLPAYAVSVAAMRGGRSLAGSVVDVDRAVTYSAGLAAGATRTGVDGTALPLRCTAVDSVSMALVATGFGYGAARRARQGRLVAELLPRVRDIRRVGSAALDMCMVAAGMVDAHYEHGLNTWDWAAGALIAAEAGARLSLPPAGSVSKTGELTVAAAPGIADELLELFDHLGVSEAIPQN
ncbi:inositol monophosphatase family protein [Nocardia terpenica]|uniref:inositol monophosphatase family protein n=1 Tax=Nocardia terpenica TaxID=455432 RepID=UPI0002F68BEF|nr:inositol monophosphatase family protein [Nocardia terpenica]NQE93199.1 inositol monophosphatase [Nocardia terpenica]